MQYIDIGTKSAIFVVAEVGKSLILVKQIDSKLPVPVLTETRECHFHNKKKVDKPNSLLYPCIAAFLQL